MLSETNRQKYYMCIDLKSFYASVECVERDLDPMTTNLVVADPERSDKTICLAVSPSMKALGVKNRCRVFEIPKNIDYIMAPPRMQKYIDYAAEIYAVYLRYISKEDIHVYSIDEAFFDVTPYLGTYGMTAKQMAEKLMEEVYKEVGVRATAGIGTNLYLAKIALDITAKHSPDFIGILDEEAYKEKLWDHTPLTDFWRVGRGTAKRLADLGIYTMRQITQTDEELLYKIFGIDAELLIDHAWGIEPVTIADIKAYTPKTNCLSSGQVLMRDYTVEEGRLILREMLESMCLDLVKKNLVTPSVNVYLRYAKKTGGGYANGTAALPSPTDSAEIITREADRVYCEMIDREKLIRGFNITCNDVREKGGEEQISMFGVADNEERLEEHEIQKTMLDIKEKFGKNAIFKSVDLKEEATTLDRNRQIGGHKSGE